MKYTFKSAFLITVLSCCINSLSAQNIKDVFKQETNLTWLGIDFSNVKILGHTDFEVEDIAARQFDDINDIILAEPKKYDLAKSFHKEKVDTDISLVKTKNTNINPDKLKSSDEADRNKFTVNTIETIIKGYDFSGKTGVGFIIFMESMSKTAGKSTMYITFVDMASKKIILTERMEEKVGGYGLRNYYAKSIYALLDDIEKWKYKKWKG